MEKGEALSEKRRMAKRLRILREESGLSNIKYAKKLGISKEMLSHMCTGQSGVSDETLFKCEKFLSSEEFKFLTDFDVSISPLEEPVEKFQTVKPTFIDDYTDEEKEIVRLLRKLPKFKDTILNSLRFKFKQQKTNYVDYIETKNNA